MLEELKNEINRVGRVVSTSEDFKGYELERELDEIRSINYDLYVSNTEFVRPRVSEGLHKLKVQSVQIIFGREYEDTVVIDLNEDAYNLESAICEDDEMKMHFSLKPEVLLLTNKILSLIEETSQDIFAVIVFRL